MVCLLKHTSFVLFALVGVCVCVCASWEITRLCRKDRDPPGTEMAGPVLEKGKTQDDETVMYRVSVFHLKSFYISIYVILLLDVFFFFVLYIQYVSTSERM